MIFELFSAIKILGSLTHSSNKNIQEASQTLSRNKDSINALLGRTNSISKMASQRIQNYPVVLSNAFGDNIEVGFDIVKYAEALFAYFLLMSIGVEPVVGKNNSISCHLSQFSGEDYSQNNSKSVIGISFPEQKWTEYELEEMYKSASKEYIHPKTLLKKFDYSREDVFDRIKNEDDIIKNAEIVANNKSSNWYEKDTNREVNMFGQYVLPDGSTQLDSRGRPITASGEIIQGDRVEVETKKQKDNLEIHSSMLGKQCETIEKRIGKSLPTSITVDLYVGEHRIPITLAVKAIPHFIESNEMKGIFKRCIENRHFLTKLIRLRTGEISFFKDFLFNLKQIKEDQEFFKNMGRHPWYRNLMDKKLKNSSQGLMRLIKNVNIFLKDQSILPTITLVTTVSELSDGISYPYFEAMKRGQINNIVNKLMLLGLFVYDQDRELLYCHLNGINHPYTFPIKDIKLKKDEDKVVQLVDAIGKLMLKSY